MLTHPALEDDRYALRERYYRAMSEHQADLPASLGDIVVACHGYMAQLFDGHQQALIERDLDLARAFWGLHVGMLQSHIRLENQSLLALHEAYVERPAWQAAVYEQEHTKVVNLAAAMQRQLVGCEGRRLTRRGVIDLLDQQRRFKNLLEHHEEREEKGLLPELDTWLPQECKDVLVARCRRQWGALIAAQQVELASLKLRLSAYPDGTD